VKVTVTKTVSRFFIGAVYSGSWSVSASATAGIDTTPGDYALITLSKTANPDIYMNGNTTIKLKGNKASAMANTNINGNGKFNVDGSIDAHGAISGAGTAPLGVHTGYPYIADPLGSTPAPPKGTARPGALAACGGSCTLQPGYYANQSLSATGTVTFAPGVYYFENSDIALKNKGLLTGTGVTLYFTGTSTFDPKNGDVDLEGPTTSLYTGGANGMVFWFAPSDCADIDLQGNGNMFFKGIFYAPCSDVTMHGNPAGDAINGQVIVNTLSVKGTSDYVVAYTKYVNTDRPSIFLVQ
jgi:hypothetical protein